MVKKKVVPNPTQLDDKILLVVVPLETIKKGRAMVGEHEPYEVLGLTRERFEQIISFENNKEDKKAEKRMFGSGAKLLDVAEEPSTNLLEKLALAHMLGQNDMVRRMKLDAMTTLLGAVLNPQTLQEEMEMKMEMKTKKDTKKENENVEGYV